MARDIRGLFKEEVIEQVQMPIDHEKRFMEKLDKAFPKRWKSRFNVFRVAASVVLLIGLSFGGYKYFKSEMPVTTVATTQPEELKTLGDVSPGLKKVEDYYLASINLELSRIEYTPEAKDLFDGYLGQLEELNKEYQRLSFELTESGPNELMVNALIDNLKFRLDLVYRLRGQLNSLNKGEESSLKSI